MISQYITYQILKMWHQVNIIYNNLKSSLYDIIWQYDIILHLIIYMIQWYHTWYHDYKGYSEIRVTFHVRYHGVPRFQMKFKRPPAGHPQALATLLPGTDTAHRHGDPLARRRRHRDDLGASSPSHWLGPSLRRSPSSSDRDNLKSCNQNNEIREAAPSLRLRSAPSRHGSTQLGSGLKP